MQAWEAAAAPAVETTRVVFLRTSLVLDKRGGLLKLMLMPFKLGAGAKLGPGTQYMSFISLQDWLRAVQFLLESPTASGPFNLTMPTSQTNAEFTDALGEALHRPTFLAAPSFALKAALGTGIAQRPARIAAPLPQGTDRCRVHLRASRSRVDARGCAVTGVPETDVARTDPRAAFVEYLDFFRAEVRRKCSGLDEHALTTSVVPSGWTLPELVEHLVHMERRWLVWGFLGEDVPDPRGDRDADGNWVTDRPIDALLDALDEGGRRTTSIIETHELTDLANAGGMFADGDALPTLLSMLLHVSQEYARHLGHVDIVRELLDGLVGDDQTCVTTPERA